MKTLYAIWLISLCCLCHLITSNDGATPSQKHCGNAKCSVPISKAKTLLRYVGVKANSVTFDRGVDVEVYSKHQNTWGIKIGNKFGYAPASFLKEFKLLIPTRNLVLVSEDVATEPVKVETTKKVAADAAVQKTEEIPAGRGSLLSFPSMAAAQSVKDVNNLPTPSSPSYEVVDGTTLWLDPVPNVQSTPEKKREEPPASQSKVVPKTTSEKPPMKPPVTTTEVPVSSSEIPGSGSTTEVPGNVNEVPVTSSEVPITSSELPITSSEAPATSSKVPVSSGDVPVTPSEGTVYASEEAPTAEVPDSSSEKSVGSDGSTDSPLLVTPPPTDSLPTPPAVEDGDNPIQAPLQELESSTETLQETTVAPSAEASIDAAGEAGPETITEATPTEEEPEAQNIEPSQPGLMSNILNTLWSSDGTEQTSQEEENDGDDDGEEGEDGDETEEEDGDEGSTEEGSASVNSNANSAEPTAAEVDQSSTVAPSEELGVLSDEVVDNLSQGPQSADTLATSFPQAQVDPLEEKKRTPRQTSNSDESLKSAEVTGVEEVSGEQSTPIPSSQELFVDGSIENLQQPQEEKQKDIAGNAESQQNDKVEMKDDQSKFVAEQTGLNEEKQKAEEEEESKLREEQQKLLEEEEKRQQEEKLQQQVEEEQKRQLEQEHKRQLEEEQKRQLEEEQKRQLEEEQKRQLEEEQKRQQEEEQRRQQEEEARRREEENRKVYEEEQELWRQNQEKQRLREEEMKRQREERIKKAREEAMEKEKEEARILEESKQASVQEEGTDNSSGNEQEETSEGVFSWFSGLFGGKNELESTDQEIPVPMEQPPAPEQALPDLNPPSSQTPHDHQHSHPSVWSADQQTMCAASEASCEMKSESEGETGFLGFNFETISLDVILLRLAATAVALFMGALSLYFLRKKHVDSGLVARINELEKQLFVASKEAIILREEASIVDTSINADEINALKEELESSRLVRADLEEQVSTLERELEEATETGIELNKLLSETLEASKGKAHAGLAASVERLQQQLDNQRDKVDSLTSSLKATSAENENLKSLVAEGKEKISALEAELAAAAEIANNIRKEREEANVLAAQELQLVQGKLEEALSSKVLEESRLGSELSALKLKYETLRSSLSLRDAEVRALQSTVKELQSGNIKADQLLDISKVKAELEHVQNERDSLLKKYQEEEKARKDMEDCMTKNEELYKKLEEKVNIAERNKEEAETRLAVLSNYFKEKEEQLQKELGLKEAIVAQHQGDESSVVKHLQLLQEEVSTYRAQNESLKQEILDQERDFKVQMATLEKKAHDNWMTARQAERRLEDSRQEAAQLRNRLTYVEKNNADPNARLDANGEGGVASPVMMMPLPPLGDMETPPPLPPFMFSPPPYPPPFMPPPLPPHPMGRPPPLGRMSSPPPPLGQFSPPPPPYDRMDRSSRSPSPPPHRYHHRSPPPPDQWGAPVGATFRPVPKPSPKKPSEQRDPRGSIHSSGHSNESMDRSRENV